MPKIKIYSTPTCPYCHLLEDYLRDRNFIFESVDVSQDKKALEELQQKTDYLSVPIIDIDGEIIVGFDKPKIDKILKIKS